MAIYRQPWEPVSGGILAYREPIDLHFEFADVSVHADLVHLSFFRVPMNSGSNG